jgi:hypothetical protein
VALPAARDDGVTLRLVNIEAQLPGDLVLERAQVDVRVLR